MISRKYWEKYHEFVLKALDLYSERVALRVVQWVINDEDLLYLSQKNTTESKRNSSTGK